MTNTFHMSALIIGILAYVLSDVNSNSGFSNTFLPFIVMLSFIYGLVVMINMFYGLRKKSQAQDKSSDLLFENMKELKNKHQAQQNIEQQEADPHKVKPN